MGRCRIALYNARLQFIVGDPDSIVTNLPDGSYTIPAAGGSQILFDLSVVNDTIEVFNEGSILPRARLDQLSYTPTYNSTQSLVDFYTGADDPGLQDDQMIIVRLQYKISL